jgi:hypothetical protein
VRNSSSPASHSCSTNTACRAHTADEASQKRAASAELSSDNTRLTMSASGSVCSSASSTSMYEVPISRTGSVGGGVGGCRGLSPEGRCGGPEVLAGGGSEAAEGALPLGCTMRLSSGQARCRVCGWVGVQASELKVEEVTEEEPRRARGESPSHASSASVLSEYVSVHVPSSSPSLRCSWTVFGEAGRLWTFVERAAGGSIGSFCFGTGAGGV